MSSCIQLSSWRDVGEAWHSLTALEKADSTAPKGASCGTVGGADQAAASPQAGPASPWGWAHGAPWPAPLGYKPRALLWQAVREGFLSSSPKPSDETVPAPPDCVWPACGLPVGRVRSRTEPGSLQPSHWPLRDENPAICQRKVPLCLPLGLHLCGGLTSG